MGDCARLDQRGEKMTEQEAFLFICLLIMAFICCYRH